MKIGFRFWLSLGFPLVGGVICLHKLAAFFDTEEVTLLPMLPLLIIVPLVSAVVAYTLGRKDQWDEETRRMLQEGT